jgi:PAS domain S-box-containing protein
MASVTHPDEVLGFDLFELLPDAIIAVDRQGFIRYANRQAGRLFRQEARTLVSSPVEALLPEHLRERHIAHRVEYNSDPHMRPMGTGLDLVARRADGTTCPVDIMLNPLKHLAEPMVLAVVRDMTERRATEEGSKERLQLALDTAQLGWWHYDPRRRVVSGDARFKEIFGVTGDEMPVEDIRSLIHTDDVERFLADRKAAVDPDNTARSSHEYRVQRRDGGVRWVEVRWLAYFDGDQRDREAVNVFGTAHDITERKERVQREQLLMREIGHRAKNMLSVVTAIARQTATQNPEDFVERFAERLQALAANQDLLIRNEWRGVDIKDLIRTQLAPFDHLIGSRIAVYGRELRLNAAGAQAVGLALHELATNAGKYGALSSDSGHLDVGWGTDGRTFNISWTEREGPRVCPPKQRGFGTTVMKAMAEGGVDGVVELDYAPSGLTWRLTCPAVNALEPMRT